MLAINSDLKAPNVVPNLLPCSIKHDGPVNAAERYWKPETDKDGHDTAYFRGRKLRGRTVRVPDGYEGVVLEKTDSSLPRTAQVSHAQADGEMGDDEDEDEKPIEVKMMGCTGRFDRVVVWGHEAVPHVDDRYVKGLEEWIAFAEAMHEPNKPNEDAQNTKS